MCDVVNKKGIQTSIEWLIDLFLIKICYIAVALIGTKVVVNIVTDVK